MSIIKPRINDLLDKTDGDRFMLCSVASKRAQDISDMMRGQRDRAIELQSAVEIAKAADKKPLSIAFDEVANGDVSFVGSKLNETLADSEGETEDATKDVKSTEVTIG